MHGKLGPRFKSVNLYATAACALAVLACHPARNVRNAGPVEWTTTLGSAQRTPFLMEHAPANPAIQWEQRFGRGYTDVPMIGGGIVIAGSTAKTITVANETTGARYWERRLNGVMVGGLLRHDDRLYAATQSRDGRVEAFRIEQGRHAWAFKMHAPAVGGAIIVDSTLFTGNNRAELFAINIETGQQRWRVRIPAPLATAPVVSGNDLVFITTRDSVLTADRTSGRVSAGILLAGSSSAPMTLYGDHLLVPVQPGTLVAVRLPGLRVDWSANVMAPILAAPAIDANGDVYVLTRTADVWRIDATGVAQRIAELGGAAAGSLTLCAEGLLIGRLDGTLFMLRRDGTQIWQRAFSHSIRSPVAVRDGSIYVPLGDGHLVMLR